jgi:hypothetical protein
MKPGRPVVGLAMTVFLLAASSAYAAVGPQEKARQLSCMNNLRQIGLAIRMYRIDHDDKMPANLQALIDKKYLSNRKVFRCPSVRPGEEGAIDYAMVKTEGKTFEETSIIVYDRTGNHAEGRNCLLYNGQVVWLAEEDFKKRMGNEKYE